MCTCHAKICSWDQRKPSSACASAQSDQGLRRPLLESLATNVSMESKGLDQTLRTCRMMWIYTFYACSKARFRLTRPIHSENRGMQEVCNIRGVLFYCTIFKPAFKLACYFSSNHFSALICLIVFNKQILPHFPYYTVKMTYKALWISSWIFCLLLRQKYTVDTLPWPPSWISDWNEFSYFWSKSRPDTSYQVLSQLAFSFSIRNSK